MEKKSLLKELSFHLIMMVVLASISILFAYLQIFNIEGQIELNYSGDITKKIVIEYGVLFNSLIAGIICLTIHLISLTIFKIDRKSLEMKKIIYYLILSVFGLLAYFVIVVLLNNFGVSRYVSYPLSGILVTIYLTLNYYLYFQKKDESNHLFWEIYRFALVGLIAAVFDFIVSFLMQFLVFKGNYDWYVTLIATTMGFIIGVTINYFLSTYMVYKASKSNMSKTFKGVVIFVLLSTLGLFIGIGVQYFLYDFLNVSKGIAVFSYPIDFIIRTLIVMVYNYISRKIIIYK